MSDWKEEARKRGAGQIGATGKVSGKQAAMLRARASNAGLRGDAAFLEWLEYDMPGGVEVKTVEDIPQHMVDSILSELEDRKR